VDFRYLQASRFARFEPAGQCDPGSHAWAAENVIDYSLYVPVD